MRNKLLFTAAMVCVEMTPYGCIHTAARAATGVDSDSATDLYGISDSAVGAAYDSNGNLQSVKDSLSGSGQTFNGSNFAAQPGVSVEGSEHLYGDSSSSTNDMLQLWGQSASTLSGGNNVNLKDNYLRITNGNASQSYTGSLTGTSATSNGVPDVNHSGGLDINSPSSPDSTNEGINQSASGTPNVVTLSGANSQSRYDGYTFVRGQGALILQDGAGIKSRGVTEVGLGRNDSGTLLVDGAGSHLDLDGSSAGGTPNSTVGALVVANNDSGYGQSATDSQKNNSLIVQNGGEVSARTITVANRSGASGTLYATGNGSKLTAGDGGLTVAAGSGNIIVDRGATITSQGVISFGDARMAQSLQALQATTPSNDYDTARGNLIIGQGGTLYAGDANVRLSATQLVDGISQNFNQDSNLGSVVYSNNQSRVSILDGMLANRTASQSLDGQVDALHTNMDIGIDGTAIFNATDTTKAALDPLASNGATSKTGITVGGSITDYTSPTTGNSTQGSLLKAGSGTLTLLGNNNSYTGSTLVNSGTLQLGGVMGASTAYGQREDARIFSENSQAIKKDVSSKVIDNLLSVIKEATPSFPEEQLFEILQKQIKEPAFQQRLASGFSQLKGTEAYKSLLKDAYTGAGSINASSPVSLAAGSRLNLAWGLDPDYVKANDLSASQQERVIANDISGTGQIVRDLRDGNDDDSATGSTKLDNVDSLTRLTGQVTLGGDSSDPALLVRKGNLAIGSADGRTGDVTILNGRNAVVGDDQGGANNQLAVQDGGRLNEVGGNLVIGNQAQGTGTVSVGHAGSRDASINLSRQDGRGGDVVVGNAGTGTLAVGEHGSLNAEGNLTLGQQAGSTGTASVTNNAVAGTDASINLTGHDGKGGNITVGDAGTGTLTVGSGSLGGGGISTAAAEAGNVNAAGNMTIGNQKGANGVVTVGNYLAPDGGDKASEAISYLRLYGTGNAGNIALGNSEAHTGTGHLNIYKRSVVSANGVSVGGQNNGNVAANSTLGVGLFNGHAALLGGTLDIGTGGLRIGEGIGQDFAYTAGVTAGGTISSAGQVAIKSDGYLKVGDGDDNLSGMQKGTLIAGDTGPGKDGYGIVSDSKQDNALSMYGNGVIRNRQGADLHIASDISLSDGHADGELRQATFDTNGQNTYVLGKLINNAQMGGGGLTKDGDGTIYLTSHDNSYADETDVRKGTLAVATGYGEKSSSNISSSSGVKVEDGATLTGYTNDDASNNGANYGAAATTTAEAGGTVEANWNNPYGSLNIGGLSHNTTGTALTMNGTAGHQSVLSVGGTSTATGGTIDLAQGTKGYDRTGGMIDTTGSTLGRTQYRQLQSGVVNVNGGAQLNSATINLEKNPNERVYAGDGYRVLSATGQVSANHDNALTGSLTAMPYISPYLVFEEGQTNGAVDIVMERNKAVGFGSPATTRNERESGAGLDVLERSNSNSGLLRNIESMGSAAEARRALNSISGEIHASARTALIQDSYLLEQAVLDRLASSGCDDDEGIATHGRYDLHDHRKNGRCYSDHAVMWGQAFGSMGHNAGDGNASLLHHQTSGFIMGVDTPVDDHWRVGGMVSYGRSMFNAGGAINSSGNSNNISLGAYAGRHWGRLNLRLGGFYSWNLMNMRRQVEVGDFGGRQTSHYRNGTARVFGELGYKLKFHKLTFEPFAGMSYVNQYAGRFREHGAAALYSKSEDQGLLFSSFGFRAARNFKLGRMQMRAHAMGAYRHAFGGIVSSRQERLMEGGGNMDIGGVPLSRDSAVVKTGVTAKLSKRIDLDLSYIGQYGNQSIESGATGSVHIAF